VTPGAKGSGKTWAVAFDSAAEMLDWTEAPPDLVDSWAPIVPLDEAIKYVDAEASRATSERLQGTSGS
jgi:hypothetical protein